MKFTLLLSQVLVAITSVVATPVPGSVALVERAADATAPTITQVLQFALTLEHLENAFYREGLRRFDANAFRSAGMPDWVYGLFTQVGQHENNHVQFLTKTLGANAPQPCTYDFPMTDVMSFVQLAVTFENVGVSAYLGGAPALGSSSTALTAAGAILTTEARHAAWINAAVQKFEPWSGSYDIPLTGNEVVTLASSFIKSCPSSNPTLPFTAYPKLAISGNVQPGQTVQLSYDSAKGNGQQLYLAFLTGLNTIFTPISSSKTAKVPSSLQGVTYAVVTTSGQSLTDDSVVAGPMILNFPFDSRAANP